jgi:uncharacterized protein (TIGR03435 family)
MLDQFVQPFSTDAVIVSVVQLNPAPVAALNPVWIWMAIWACGTFAVGVYWMMRWLRIRAAVRNSTLMPMPMDTPIPVRSSRMLIEPGVVGLFRPVLLLPEGISERLTPQQLQTILTHEMCHVRRRDNLTAAIHMLVEALFWFNPVVWWLGRRMIVEREAACDEAVIASGGDREAYAEALLTVCKFYVESPLASAAGVSGADLKKRISRIMTESVTRKLDFSRKLLLSVAGFVAVAVPIVFGLANVTQTRAESQPENMAVAESVATSPESPAHSRGESLAENKAAARAGDIGNYIAALGTVTPVNTVSVTSRVQGQIMDVRYTEGQMVHKGDPLLDIDPRPYQAALTQMEGQLARDQAALDEARINAKASQQMGFQAQTIQQDEGAVQNDEGQVQIARVNLQYCHITSPIDGRVGLRLVDPGNLVQANGTNPLVVVTQIQPITVIFNVAEDRLPQIERQLGMGQRLAVDVFDRTETKKFASGYLLAADNQIDTATGTVKLRAIFPNTDSSLFPNQFVNVKMETSAALQTKASSNATPPPCNVTIPNGRGSYGNGKLWTTLPADGILDVVPDEHGRLSEKFVWDRTVHGHLSVSGRRLDGPGNFQTGPLGELSPGRDTGLLVEGLVFPSEGCWQVTGSAGDAELAFVMYVHSRQEAAEVVGTVWDTSGKALPGATVTLMNASKNTSQTTQTSGRGDYDFNSLKAGMYTVKVKAKGFKPGMFKVGLAAWDRARVDAKMEAGDAAQTTTAAPQAQNMAAGAPSFEVASIKPNKSGDNRAMRRPQVGGLFSETNYTVRIIIETSYQLKPHQMIAGPEWDRLLAEHFDIEAKAEGNPPKDQMNLMLRSLLADRFKLVVHHETRQLPVYALVLPKAGKTGRQLTPHSDGAKCTDPALGLSPPGPDGTLPAPCGSFSIVGTPGGLRDAGNNVTMDMFVALLGNYVDRPVVDRTGQKGTYDLTFEFEPPLGPGSQPSTDASASAPPSIFTALQEQLGLKLESQTGPVDVLVIDHVEEPSAN